MEFNTYQDAIKKTAIYDGRSESGEHDIEGIKYTALGLGGETGEIFNKVKKIIRDKNGIISVDDRSQLLDELGDCLWYLSELSYNLGLSLDEVAQRNIEKINSRLERNVIHGSGDNR